MQSFKLTFLGVTILQGVKFPIFLLIFEWALQQCSATALPVIFRRYLIIIIIIIITRLVTHVKLFTKWRIASAGGHESAKVSSVVKFSLYQTLESCKTGEVGACLYSKPKPTQKTQQFKKNQRKIQITGLQVNQVTFVVCTCCRGLLQRLVVSVHCCSSCRMYDETAR